MEENGQLVSFMLSNQEVLRHLNLFEVTKLARELVSINIMMIHISLTINFHDIEFYHIKLSLLLGGED